MKKIIALIFPSLLFITVGFSQKTEVFETFKTDSKIIFDICFTDKGKAIGIADNNTIKLFSVNSESLLREFKNGHNGRILSIDISKDSTLLVSGGRDSTIVLWDMMSGKILKSLSCQKGVITSVKISPSGKYLISGGSDNKVHLYDIKNNKVIREFSDQAEDINALSFSPDGKIFASASGDRTINIYDTESFKLISSLTGHKSSIRDISFSPDGLKLVSCGDDSRIINWDLSDLDAIKRGSEIKIGHDWVLSVDYSSDGKTFAFGSLNGKAEITGQFANYKINIGYPVNEILFVPNHYPFLKIVVATSGNGVMLIEAAKMKSKDK